MPLTPSQLDLFRACTGRQDAPSGGFGEVTVIAGARAGKDSRISAPIMCYEALFGGHEVARRIADRRLTDWWRTRDVAASTSLWFGDLIDWA